MKPKRNGLVPPPKREDYKISSAWLAAMEVWSKLALAYAEKAYKEAKKVKADVLPSKDICFECPFNGTCHIKGEDLVLCPQLMILNGRKYISGKYWRNIDECLQEETIRLN